MSIEVISLVISRRVGSPTKKSVLLVMADCANPDGSGVFLSKPSISRRTEVSLATVSRSIKSLLASNLISKGERHKITNGFTQTYHLNLEAIRALPRTKKEDDSGLEIDTPQIEGGSLCTPDTPSQRPLTPPHSDPQTVKEPSVNRQFLSRVRDEWNGMARQVGLPECELMGSDRAVWVGKCLSLVDGNEETVLASIRRVPNNDHWTGANGKGFQATFDWVFKDPVRFRQALESVPAPQTPKAQNDRPNPPRKTADSEYQSSLDRAAEAAMEQAQLREASGTLRRR